MILPGGGSRLQTLGGLAAQWFDSTLRTYFYNHVGASDETKKVSSFVLMAGKFTTILLLSQRANGAGPFKV